MLLCDGIILVLSHHKIVSNVSEVEGLFLLLSSFNINPDPLLMLTMLYYRFLCFVSMKHEVGGTYLNGVRKFELYSQYCLHYREWPFVIPYNTL